MIRLIERMPMWLRDLVESAALAQTLLLTSLGVVLANPLWRALIGEIGYTAVLILLSFFAALSATARRSAIDWTNALPLSLALYAGWAVVSVVWSYQPGDSAWRLVNFLTTGFLGLYIAWTRDTIQIVRGAGDVLRLLLSLSLVSEFVAALFGSTFRIGTVSGGLFSGGLVQGVTGSRGALAFLALIALFTFAIEWRTRSIRRVTAVLSMVLAALMFVLAGSPVSVIALTAVGIAFGAIWVLRRAKPRARWRWNAAFAALGVVAVSAVWVLRVPLIVVLDGRGETSSRVHLWQEMSRYLLYRPLQGWGFSGTWWVGGPYEWIQESVDKTLGSGMNAYIDVYFQLGVIGLGLFLVLLGTTVVRSWTLAGNRRSVIYVWPALVGITLAIVSVADSFVLTGAGWLLLVVAAVKSARELTWGDAWATRTSTSLPSRAGR